VKDNEKGSTKNIEEEDDDDNDFNNLKSATCEKVID